MSPGADPRPGLRKVEPYSSPQIDVPVRLNTNEMPSRLPESFFAMLAAVVREIPLNRYPDGQITRLREKLSAHVGHPIEMIWPANGSNEVLEQLFHAYGGPKRKVVIFDPTYLLHPRLAWLTHTKPLPFSLQPPYVLGTKDVDVALQMKPHMVLVCSPNNPTGNAQPVDSVRRLAERSDALVIVDEAYIEFGGESALPLIEEYPNIVIVRTLSKAFAMAGARLGYCVAWPQVIEDLQRVRLPYHLSTLTQAAGIAALIHADEALALVEQVRAERDRIVTVLGAIDGIQVFPSDANFVLFCPPKPAREVWQGLLDRGVLVRDVTAAIPNALRVSAGTTHEVDRFFDALKEVLV